MSRCGEWPGVISGDLLVGWVGGGGIIPWLVSLYIWMSQTTLRHTSLITISTGTGQVDQGIITLWYTEYHARYEYGHDLPLQQHIWGSEPDKDCCLYYPLMAVDSGHWSMGWWPWSVMSCQFLPGVLVFQWFLTSGHIHRLPMISDTLAILCWSLVTGFVFALPTHPPFNVILTSPVRELINLS